MKKCLFCANEFEQPTRGRKKLFCSRQCQMARVDEKKKSALPELVQRSCKNCQKSFLKPRNSQRKLCSTKCRKDLQINFCCGCFKAISANSDLCRSCVQLGRVPWNKKHSDRITERQIRRNREKSAPGLQAQARKDLLKKWQKQNRSCFYCEQKCESVDHVIPLVRGGTNFLGNLVPACRKCNSSKGSKFLSEWKIYARATA